MMIFNGHLMKQKVRSCYTRTRADDISITSLIFLTEDGTEFIVPHVQHTCFFPIRPIKFLIYIDVVTVAVIDANGPYFGGVLCEMNNMNSQEGWKLLLL